MTSYSNRHFLPGWGGGLQSQRCGFVGSGLIGLSHIDDVRPEEQRVEFWKAEPRHPDAWDPLLNRPRLSWRPNLSRLRRVFALPPARYIQTGVPLGAGVGLKAARTWST